MDEQKTNEQVETPHVAGIEAVIKRLGYAVGKRANDEDVQPVMLVCIVVYEDGQYDKFGSGAGTEIENAEIAARLCSDAAMNYAAGAATAKLLSRCHVTPEDPETIERLKNGDAKIQIIDTVPDIDNDRG